MPKILLSVISLLLFLIGYPQKADDSSSAIKRHNKIDDISTALQIEKMLKQTNKRYSDFHVINLTTSNSECGRLSDSVHAIPYFKADFDHNGYTDLIVVVSWRNDPMVLCLLDSGKKNPGVIWLSNEKIKGCSYPVLSSAGSNPAVDYYYSIPDHFTDSGVSYINEHKKLIFKSGGFVEYNPAPRDYKIEKVEYETTMCFGTCPVFKMTIDSSREAVYESIKYNAQKAGKYQTRIDKKTYFLLEDLLNYINFPMLKNSYLVNWTDDQTSTLKITYDNGKVKTIRDYGLLATFGLSQAYKILFNLRGNQQWQ